jgi:hypothetical protein
MPTDGQTGRQEDMTNLLFGYELFGTVCYSFPKILSSVPKKNIPLIQLYKRTQ